MTNPQTVVFELIITMYKHDKTREMFKLDPFFTSPHIIESWVHNSCTLVYSKFLNIITFFLDNSKHSSKVILSLKETSECTIFCKNLLKLSYQSLQFMSLQKLHQNNRKPSVPQHVTDSMEFLSAICAFYKVKSSEEMFYNTLSEFKPTSFIYQASFFEFLWFNKDNDIVVDLWKNILFTLMNWFILSPTEDFYSSERVIQKACNLALQIIEILPSVFFSYVKDIIHKYNISEDDEDIYNIITGTTLIFAKCSKNTGLYEKRKLLDRFKTTLNSKYISVMNLVGLHKSST